MLVVNSIYKTTICLLYIKFRLNLTLYTIYLQTIDDWSFDVFSLNEACNGQVLKILSCELLNRYGLLSKFKVRLNFQFSN